MRTFLFLLPVALLAAEPASVADLRALAAENPPWLERTADGTNRVVREPSDAEFILWQTRQADRVAEKALAYFRAHGDAPDRWEAALIALEAEREFVREVRGDPARDGDTALVRDQEAAAQWQQQAAGLAHILLHDSAVPADVLGRALAVVVRRKANQLARHAMEEVGEIRAMITAAEQRAPEHPHLMLAYERYADWIAKLRPRELPTLLATLASSANPTVATWAAGRMKLDAAESQPLQMQFTALDGRTVDISKLRGKVVLIDFWATWCGPCKAELPNVKAAYEKYHDRGFEVIGISLDSEKDRQKLIDYCAEQDLPWPQHFDGRGWKNRFAVEYSIRGIPAMFLLDQSGRVVSRDARGDTLETEIQRLLEL